ncbi:polyketide synthase protein [Rutstroemia sp. NJR-2017a BBW]|nr:polyketide synthase protein [Rutstroemia sp. NJR-2017a BBW]
MAPGKLNTPTSFPASEASSISSGLDQSTLDSHVLEPLAIVGFSHKFPEDATTAEAFWNMLEEGRCVSSEFPKDRMNIDAFYHADEKQGTSFRCTVLLYHTSRSNSFRSPAARPTGNGI